MKKPLPIGIGQIKQAKKTSSRPKKLSDTPRKMQATEEDTARLLSVSLLDQTELDRQNTYQLPTESHIIEEETDTEEGQLSVDIYQTDSDIIVLAPIAGVAKDQISLSITDDILSIKGKRKTPHNVADDQYFTKECFWGTFSRSIVLPTCVDKTNIKAKFSNGILEIHLAKTENLRTKIIKINS